MQATTFDGKHVDSHVHTIYSYDAIEAPLAQCERAIQSGVTVAALTDHCDMRDHKNGYQSYFGVAEARHAEIDALKQSLCGKLVLLNGIELGDVGNQPALAKRHLAQYPYDFVLGSVHHVRDGVTIDYDSAAPDILMTMYFDEIEALLDFGDFDSLAHLDYPTRHWRITDADLLAFRDRIHAVLARLAKMDKALELNTSGLYGAQKRIGPEQWVLEDFRACGGRYITFGSDAHHAEHVGFGLNQAYQLARKAGFTSAVFYRKREPISYALQ